ncbi:MFS general substrate transporter [Biscogniauxia mediterranea]|nr:MFS general substrate transporter [Biscogniauxia mediterranea]
MTINRSMVEDRGSSSFARPDPESLELIRDDDDDDDDEKPQASSPVRWRDLPNKDQLFILSLCRLSEPLSNVCILPYVFFLVRSVLLSSSSSPSPPPHTTNPENNDTVTASRISVYSGLLVSSFPLAQCATSLAWGALSDRRGRRPAIAAGLAISALANAGFALVSSSFAALLAWRVLAGLANGTVGVARAATAEAVCGGGGGDPRFRARAFLLLPLVFNAGVAASLALGGCLADDPVANLPWLFGSDGWLNAWALEHPYALPPLLNAAVLGAVLVLAVLGLRETLPVAREAAHDDVGLRAGAAVARWASWCWTRCRCRPREHGYAEIENEEERLAGEPQADREEPQEAPTKQPGRSGGLASRGIWTRKVLCALVSFGLLPLHNSAFMHIFPVYLSSPPSSSSSDGNNSTSSESTLFAFAGGLGLRSSAIGLWLSAFGVGGILLQLFIYLRLQARIGTRGVFRVALWLFPPTYAAAPYLSLVSTAGGVKWVFLACVVCAQIAARTMAIPSTVILLTEAAAPGRAVLGTVHGAGNTLASLARAVGPAVGGYVFALGVDAGVVGLVWWFYLVVVALCALAWSYIMEGDG